jgi:hypothetical protein
MLEKTYAIQQGLSEQTLTGPGKLPPLNHAGRALNGVHQQDVAG